MEENKVIYLPPPGMLIMAQSKRGIKYKPNHTNDFMGTDEFKDFADLIR